MLQENEFRPSSFHPTLHLSTLPASLVDTGRGTVSCWLHNRHTACPLDTASPCKDHWTPGTVLLWQNGTHMISMWGITLHPREHRKRSRVALCGLWAERQENLNGLLQVWVSVNSNVPASAKTHRQTEVGCLQRIHGAPPIRFNCAKVVLGPTLAEKRSHHTGSDTVDWSGSYILVITWIHHWSLDFSHALSLLWKT